MGATPDPGDGTSRAHLWVLLLLLATVVVVVAPVRRPPILDLPLLFEQAAAFEEVLAGARHDLTFDGSVPNRLGYVPILVARAVAPTAWEPRVAVLLVAAIWLTSMAGLASIAKRPPAATLLVAPLLFGNSLYAGFFSFLAGPAALLYWTVELDDRRRERSWFRLAVSTAIGAALLYQAHIAWLLVGGLAVATVVLLHRFSLRELAARILGLLPVAVASSAWSPAGTGWQGEMRYVIHPGDRVGSLDMASSLAMGGIRHPVEKVMLVALLGWIALGALRTLRERGAGVQPFLLVAGGLFLATALLAPNEIDKMVQVAWRWGGLALATLVLALPPPALDRRILTTLAGALLAAHSWVTAEAWRRYADLELSGFESVLGEVPSGARLLGVDLAPRESSFATYPSVHLYAWAATERGASIRSTFSDTGHGLVRWVETESRDPIAEILVWRPRLIRKTDLATYSHVLVHGSQASSMAWAADKGSLRLVQGEGFWGLFENRPTTNGAEPRVGNGLRPGRGDAEGDRHSPQRPSGR